MYNLLTVNEMMQRKKKLDNLTSFTVKSNNKMYIFNEVTFKKLNKNKSLVVSYRIL